MLLFGPVGDIPGLRLDSAFKVARENDLVHLRYVKPNTDLLADAIESLD
jgi:hypothetical protein